MSADDLRARLEADQKTIQTATKGPWFATDRGIGWEVTEQPLQDKPDDPGFWPERINDGQRETFTKEDAQFIAAARTGWEKANTALLKVLELHKRDEYDECSACMNAYGDGIPYPCRTVEPILEVYADE